MLNPKLIGMISEYFPYFLSIITLYSMWLQGDKNKKSWILTFVNQLLWLIWIFASGKYGFLPMNLGICYTSVRNYKKWNKT